MINTPLVNLHVRLIAIQSIGVFVGDRGRQTEIVGSTMAVMTGGEACVSRVCRRFIFGALFEHGSELNHMTVDEFRELRALHLL